MKTKQWSASAPSNIALIKYMGKTDAATNIPTNASLSYTLDYLLTTVELTLSSAPQDSWEPLADANIKLSAAGQQRFLNYLKKLKHNYGFEGAFIVRSGNNFPADCGLASSASSYAALTKCAIKALSELTQQPQPSLIEQASLSRTASGSSCRSFHSGWVLWSDTTVEPIEFPQKNLLHQVIIVSHAKKSPSSTEAHQRIQSSQLFSQRPQRAQQNLATLTQALKTRDWQQAYQTVWEEFIDMHQLFETAQPPFRYMTGDSQQVLTDLQQFWGEHQDGPIVTMDAGPNIHCLYRPDQQAIALELEQKFAQNYQVFASYKQAVNSQPPPQVVE